MKAAFLLTLFVSGSLWAQTPAQQNNQQWEAWKAKAYAAYPDATKDGSPLAVEVARLMAELRRVNDPVLGSPMAPIFIVSAAAANLGIAPAVVRVSPQAAQAPVIVRNPYETPSEFERRKRKVEKIARGEWSAADEAAENLGEKLDDVKGAIDRQTMELERLRR